MLGLAKFRPAVKQLLKGIIRQQTNSRNASSSSFRYREINTNVPRGNIIVATALMGGTWYWIMWHCWYQFDHIKGHDIPDPLQWTNKELGIPPDEEDY